MHFSQIDILRWRYGYLVFGETSALSNLCAAQLCCLARLCAPPFPLQLLPFPLFLPFWVHHTTPSSSNIFVVDGSGYA